MTFSFRNKIFVNHYNGILSKAEIIMFTLTYSNLGVDSNFGQIRTSFNSIVNDLVSFEMCDNVDLLLFNLHYVDFTQPN